MTLWSNPWSVFDELGDMQGRFNRLVGSRGDGRCGCHPRMDVWGDEDKIVVDLEVPGVEPKDVEISVEDSDLTIAGELVEPEREEKSSVYRRERDVGKFSRAIRLPFPVDPDRVMATCRNGLLRVTAPRAEASKPHRIKINAA
jgi:HSP20 family protein